MMVLALVAAVLAVVSALAWVRDEQRRGEVAGAADATATGSLATDLVGTDPVGTVPPATDQAASQSVAGPTATGPMATGPTVTVAGPTATGSKPTGSVSQPTGPGTGSVVPTDPPVTDPPPAAVVVPAVAGKTEAEARTTLSTVDLSVGSTTRVASCAVAKDRAIGTTPAAGAQAHEGDAVTLQLSNGVPAAKVPAVVGQGEKAATATMAGAGFTVAIKAVFLPKGDAKIGLVTAQSTAAGGTVSTCSAITLTVGRQQLVITNPTVTLAPPTTVGKLAP